jgi:hypothetical protein
MPLLAGSFMNSILFLFVFVAQNNHVLAQNNKNQNNEILFAIQKKDRYNYKTYVIVFFVRVSWIRT